jgi:hypothetical protein
VGVWERSVDDGRPPNGAGSASVFDAREVLSDPGDVGRVEWLGDCVRLAYEFEAFTIDEVLGVVGRLPPPAGCCGERARPGAAGPSITFIDMFET